MPTQAEQQEAFRSSLPWRGALGHLEQNHPEELARLLREGRLEQRLDQLARDWWLMENRLEEQLPNASRQERYEVVNGEIFPPNPKAHLEKPLNPQEEKLLAEFRESREI